MSLRDFLVSHTCMPLLQINHVSLISRPSSVSSLLSTHLHWFFFTFPPIFQNWPCTSSGPCHCSSLNPLPHAPSPIYLPLCHSLFLKSSWHSSSIILLIHPYPSYPTCLSFPCLPPPSFTTHELQGRETFWRVQPCIQTAVIEAQPASTMETLRPQHICSVSLSLVIQKRRKNQQPSWSQTGRIWASGVQELAVWWRLSKGWTQAEWG